MFGRIFLGVVLCATIFTSSGWAQVPEPIDTSRQQVNYDFDGIEGTLDWTAYIGEGSDQSVSVSLRCSKESTSIRVSFEGVKEWTPGSPDHAPGTVVIGTSVIGALQLDRIEGLTSYVGEKNERLLSVVKSLYDNLPRGIIIRASEVETRRSGTRYFVRLTGPFQKVAILPLGMSETIDQDEVRHKIGRFHQLCSIWWGD